jgi:hypothetical protein
MTTTRRTVRITKKEKAIWKKEFIDYGAKSEAFRFIGVSVQTIRNIVSTGRGLDYNIDRIRIYIDLIQPQLLETIFSAQVVHEIMINDSRSYTEKATAIRAYFASIAPKQPETFLSAVA